jgi:hypothetical protein
MKKKLLFSLEKTIVFITNNITLFFQKWMSAANTKNNKISQEKKGENENKNSSTSGFLKSDEILFGGNSFFSGL